MRHTLDAITATTPAGPSRPAGRVPQTTQLPPPPPRPALSDEPEHSTALAVSDKEGHDGWVAEVQRLRAKAEEATTAARRAKLAYKPLALLALLQRCCHKEMEDPARRCRTDALQRFTNGALHVASLLRTAVVRGQGACAGLPSWSAIAGGQPTLLGEPDPQHMKGKRLLKFREGRKAALPNPRKLVVWEGEWPGDAAAMGAEACACASLPLQSPAAGLA